MTFSLNINQCNSNAEYYVDTNIFSSIDNKSDWLSWQHNINRSSYDDIGLSYYFNNTETSNNTFLDLYYFERTTSFPFRTDKYYSYSFTSYPSIKGDYVYSVGNVGYGTILFQINKTLFDTNSSYQISQNIEGSFSYTDVNGVIINSININSNNYPIYSDDYLYIANTTGTLFQLDINNISKIINKFNTGKSISSTPIYDNGFIYLWSDNEYIYKLNSSNVSIQYYNYTFGQNTSSSLLIDGNYIYATSKNRKLFKLNSNDLSYVQNVSLNQTQCSISPTTIDQSPSLYKQNIYLPIGCYIYKINTNDLNTFERANYTIKRDYDSVLRQQKIIYRPFLWNDYLYISTFDNFGGYLLQLNINNISKIENKVTNFYQGYPIDTWSLPVVTDGILQIMSGSDNIAYPNKRINQMYASNISFLPLHKNWTITYNTALARGISQNLLFDNNSIYVFSNHKYHDRSWYYNFVTMTTISDVDIGDKNNPLTLRKFRNVIDDVYYPLQQCPSIYFSNLTETNNSIINRSNIIIDLYSYIGTFNIKNINVKIFNDTNLLFEYNTTSPNLYINQSLINNGTQYFNASITDDNNKTIRTTTRKINVLFGFIFGNCFDKIKNQNEIGIDYGGTCGKCGNYSVSYQDSAFTIIKESGLYSIPFNENQCQDGNAVSGAYLFLILIAFLLLFIFIIVLFIFGIVPLIIFIFFGRFWFPFFSRRKKEKSQK